MCINNNSWIFINLTPQYVVTLHSFTAAPQLLPSVSLLLYKPNSLSRLVSFNNKFISHTLLLLSDLINQTASEIIFSQGREQ
jgi:hypothetical protein